MASIKQIKAAMGNTNGKGNKGKIRKKTIKAWAVIIPGTNEPAASVDRYGRYYIILCDPDAKEQAERMAKEYPMQKAVEVTLTYNIK